LNLARLLFSLPASAETGRRPDHKRLEDIILPCGLVQHGLGMT
jgi:hypothetical protein